MYICKMPFFALRRRLWIKADVLETVRLEEEHTEMLFQEHLGTR